jgi:hypothetical protein
MNNSRMFLWVVLSMAFSFGVAFAVAKVSTGGVGVLVFFVVLALTVKSITMIQDRLSRGPASPPDPDLKAITNAHRTLVKRTKQEMKKTPAGSCFTRGIPSEVREGAGGALVLGLIDKWESSATDALPRIPDLIHPDKTRRDTTFRSLKKTLNLSVNLLSPDVSAQYRRLLVDAKYQAEQFASLRDTAPQIGELIHMVDHPNG